MRKVTIGNIVKEYEAGTTYEMVVKESFPDRAEQIILVKVNGKLEELAKKIKRDCTIEPIFFSDNPGYNSYRRSVTFLMLKATHILCQGLTCMLWASHLSPHSSPMRQFSLYKKQQKEQADT